jgi:hypothetical protein
MKAFVLLICLVLFWGIASGQSIQDAKANISTIDIPRLFVMNEGQWDARITASSMGMGPTVSFGREGYRLSGRMSASSPEIPDMPAWQGLRLAQRSSSAELRAGRSTNAKFRWYDGRESNPSALSLYESLVYRNAWSGVDVEIEGKSGGIMHTIRVDPSKAPPEFTMHFDNVRREQLHVDSGHGNIRIAETNGGVDVSMTGGSKTSSFTVNIGLNFFWGGSDDDEYTELHVDRAGNLHITGKTRSADFPIIPANRPAAGQFAYWAMKCSPDGKQVYYSSAFESWGYEIAHSAIGLDDRLVFIHRLNTRFREYLTPDARYPGEIGCGLFVLDTTGALVYGSALPDSTDVWAAGLCTGADGSIYVLLYISRQPLFVSPDAVLKEYQGGRDGYLIKLDAVDYRLVYATCLGTAGDDFFESFAIDGCGGVAYVNAHYDATALRPDSSALGWYKYEIARLSPDASRFLFRRTFHGCSNVHWERSFGEANFFNSRRLQFDPEEQLYFASTTEDKRFPIHGGSVTSGNTNNDILIAKLSQRGELLYSTYVGGVGQEVAGGIAVDSCGRLVLEGWSTSGTSGAPQTFPLVNPLYTEGNRVLVVIDTESGVLEFSSFMAWMDWHGGGSGLVMKDASVYTVASSMGGVGLPVTPGFSAPSGPHVSAMITRFDIPMLCGAQLFAQPRGDIAPLDTRLQLPDTIRVDLTRRTVSPSVITISGSIRNLSPYYAADSVDVRLELAQSLALAPASAPFGFRAGGPGPLDSLRITWSLIPDIDSIAPSTVLRGALLGSSGGPCATPVRLPFEIPVVYTDVPEAELHCDLTVTPRLKLTTGKLRLAADSLLISLTIANLSATVGSLRHVALEFPASSGLTLISPTDAIVAVPHISGGASIAVNWIALIQSWPFDRPIAVSAVLVDTFDIAVARCGQLLVVPGSNGSACALSITDTVWYRSDTGAFDPSPIVAVMTLGNPCDSLRPYRNLVLDLTDAPHLKAAMGENLSRPDFTIDAGQSRNFSWRLQVFPKPSQTVHELVRVRYRTNADTMLRECSARIVIMLLSSDVACEMHAQDSLHLDASGLRFTEDSILVTAEFRNTGSLPQPLHHATISFPGGEHVEVLNGVEQPLSVLPIGIIKTAVWRIRVPAYTFARNVEMTATAYDSAGKAITSCSDFIHAPAIVLQCGITAPDSVRYDAASGNYTPERFEVTASLFNASDTALTNLRAILDSTQFQRAKLTASSFALQSRAELLSGETWDVRWELEPLYGDRDVAELFRVRFEYTPSNLYTFCERGVIIGGAPHIASMVCSTAGHDTVWADSFHETLLPDPVQVQYTLRNTGNIPTPACELAIVPPPMLLLEAGEDSIRSVPVLQPGDAFSAEWLLRIDMDRILPGQWPVRWVTQCADGIQPPVCEHRISLRENPPMGVVLTPWLLRFEAERNGPLPTSQEVQVWTGGGLAPSWSVSSVPAWLDVSPLFGAGRTTLTVGPNTTALAEGVHSDRIVLSETPISTGDVQVIYTIRVPLGVDNGTRPGTHRIGAVYPNPASAGATLVVEYRNSSSAEITLTLHDLLGRERYTANHRATDGGLLHVSTRDLPPGAYVLRVRSGSTAAEKLVIVVP